MGWDGLLSCAHLLTLAAPSPTSPGHEIKRNRRHELFIRLYLVHIRDLPALKDLYDDDVDVDHSLSDMLNAFAHSYSYSYSRRALSHLSLGHHEIKRNRTKQAMLTQVFVALEASVFESNLGKKIVALGLTSLLSLPTASLPPAVTSVLPHAFSAVVNVSQSARPVWCCALWAALCFGVW